MEVTPLGKGSSWINVSLVDHTMSISKYNPLAGSSYFKTVQKDLINIQNPDDNECFKWFWPDT